MPLCLLDLDNTLLAGRTILTLAQRFDVEEAVAEALAQDVQHASLSQSQRVMQVFAGVDAAQFWHACAQTPLRAGALEACERLRQSGFELAIATASYMPAAERAAQRIGATMWTGAAPEVEHGRLTGRLGPPQWTGQCGQHVCKGAVARAWRDALLVAIGDGANDVCMFREADLAIAMSPCDDAARAAADVVVTAWPEVPRIVAGFAGAPTTLPAQGTAGL